MAITFDPHFSSDRNPLIVRLSASGVLSAPERNAIAALPIIVRTYKAGQELIREGDRPTLSCLLLDGFACRSKTVGEGRRQIFSFHMPGDVPDLHNLFLDVMDHDLVTISTSRVAFISHASLRLLISDHPGLVGPLWRETLIDAAIFREWMVGMGQRNGLARVAHLLCETVVRMTAVGLMEDRVFKLPFTQEQIGDAVGLSLVHVSRVFKELRGRKLIRTEARTLKIRDWDGLKTAGEFDQAYLHRRGMPSPD